MDNREDPGAQMAWLENELKQIEADDGFAYIISHIPSEDCLHQFGIRWKALTERYQHIIRFTSEGHSHDFQVRVNKALTSKNPIGWQLITGSGTSDGLRNPSFTVIDWDEEFMVPVNTHTYTFDLAEANLNPTVEPNWHPLNDFVSEYKMKDMSPASILDFTNRMATDGDLTAQYLWNQIRQAGPRPAAQVASKGMLCEMTTTETFETADCNGSPHILPFTKFDTDSMMEEGVGNWIRIN